MTELFKKLWKQYYIKNIKDIPIIPEINKHEFGWKNWEGQYIRHLVIKNKTELKKLLLDNIPMSFYISTSKYTIPNDIKSKLNWLGSTLIFDIDLKDLPIKDCSATHSLNINGQLVILPCQKCLSKCKQEVTKLIKVMEERFDLKNYYIFFSGNAGYHIYYFDDEYFKINRYGRQMISEYLTEKCNINIDSQVTNDISRIFRYPNSINEKSGLTKIPITNMNINPYKEACKLPNNPIKIKTTQDFEITLGNKKHIVNDGAIIPTYLGVWCELKNIGKIYIT